MSQKYKLCLEHIMKMNKTIIFVLVMAVAICFTIPTAQAELLTIKGDDILISFESGESIIKRTGFADVHESKVKIYNSGGFSLKNPSAGIFIWGHTSGDSQYKMTVLTSEGFQRLVGDIVTFDEPKTTKSSVGADISKWDIPTEGRKEHTYIKPVDVHEPDSLDILFSVPNNVQWKHNLNFDLITIDTQITNKKDQRLANVDVWTSIINPIGKVVGTWNGTTGDFGMFGDEYYIVDNQMIGQYTFKAHVEKENYNPISKMISFFVLPLDNDGSSPKCPSGYFYNSTSSICQEE